MTHEAPRRDIDHTSPDGKIRRECKQCGLFKRRDGSNFHHKVAKNGAPAWAYTCKSCESAERRVRRAVEPGRHLEPPPELPRTPPPIMGWCWWECSAWNPEPVRKQP
jgi:hypothetical protein